MMDNNMLAILIVLNAIGIPTIIGFVANLWFKTTRNDERLAELEKKQSTHKDTSEQDLKTLTESVNQMKITLTELTTTIKLWKTTNSRKPPQKE